LSQGDGAYDGMSMWPHLPTLNQLAQTFVTGDVLCALEIGVHVGHSTVALLAALESTGGSLISIDIESPGEFMDELLPVERSVDWTFVEGDSQSPETAESAKKEVMAINGNRNAVGLLFVDGAFENRLADLQVYAPLVSSPGIIVVHDTNRACVYESLQSYLSHAEFDYRLSISTAGHGLATVFKLPNWGV
jgi:predicted O-methyltransferase YrrM